MLEISKFRNVFRCLKVVTMLANNTDSDEMQHSVVSTVSTLHVNVKNDQFKIGLIGGFTLFFIHNMMNA